MTIIDRYLIRHQLPPFLFAFTTIMFLFLISYLTRFLDRLVGKGIELSVIVELIALQLAWMVVVTAPIAMLSSSLIAFGNLSSSLEITAMQAGGISPLRIMLAPLGFGLIMALSVERFGNEVLPEANHLAKVLTIDITRKKPSFGLEENVFSEMLQGYSILVQKTYENASRADGVIIYDYTTSLKSTVIRAATADFYYTADYRFLVMTLFDGEMHEMNRDSQDGYKRIRFERHKILFNADGFGFSRSDESTIGRSDREMSAADMLRLCDSLRQQFRISEYRSRSFVSDALRAFFLLPQADSLLLHTTFTSLSERYHQIQGAEIPKGGDLGITLSITPPGLHSTFIDAAATQVGSLQTQLDGEVYSIRSTANQINRYLVEVHKKYSIPFACLFFVLVGVPLGILARRGGIGVGAGFSLLFFMIYWGSLISGEKLADRDLIPPFISMWIGNAILIVLGSIFIWRMTGGVFPRPIQHTVDFFSRYLNPVALLEYLPQLKKKKH